MEQKKVELSRNLNTQRQFQHNNNPNFWNTNTKELFNAYSNTDTYLENIITRLNKIEQSLSYILVLSRKIEIINNCLEKEFLTKYSKFVQILD